MLNNAHFYNRTIRKVVVAFGTLFNEIYILRQNKAGTNSFEKLRVPLSYGAKEKYITRLTADPDLLKSVATVVPRISFEMTGMSYDSSRKQISKLQNFSQNENGGLNAQYAPVPYDFSFSLSIYVRNTEDGTQIIEQILPFFTPDFTVTVDFIPNMDQKYDLPIILNSVNTTTDYEGDMMTTRLITWDLEFTVKGYIWPAIRTPNGLIGAFSNTANAYGSSKIELYNEQQTRTAQQVKVDYANGNNFFSTGETIRVDAKNITGEVIYFSNTNTGTLIVGNLNKILTVGDVVRGDYTRAVYTIDSVVETPLKAVTITTTPVPQSSQMDDEFGFAESIVEWPNNL
jgi:hypothetical protein